MFINVRTIITITISMHTKGSSHTFSAKIQKV